MSTPFDPNEFFLLASRMVRAANEESEFRTSIGRAYYACYLTATNQMFDIDGRRLTRNLRNRLAPKAGSHEAVLKAIASNTGVRKGDAVTYSQMFAQLKDLRVQADYKTDTAGEPQQYFVRYGVKDWAGLAQQALILASQLLPSLRRLARHRR